MIKLERKNRYNNLTFEDFIIDDSNRKLVDYMKSYCTNIKEKIDNCENVIISGNVGVGKTMISRIVQNELKNIDICEDIQTSDFDYEENTYKIKEKIRKLNVQYISCPHLIKVLREHFSKEKEENFTFHCCDVLIIDEVGVQYNTDNERITLYDLFNYRYENYKPTILISNNPLYQIEKTKIDGLNKILGSRIIDRINSGTSKYFFINSNSKRRHIG